MKILFIGATGMLGKPVAAQLLQSGFELTLLARDPVKMQQAFPAIKIIQGDVFDKESLEKAFAGQEAVYINLSVLQYAKQKDLQPERKGIDNIIAAAAQTGIKKIAYLSSLVHLYEGMNGFNWWVFRLKQEAVAKIKDSGIGYTIFYPSTFMETFPYQMMRGTKIAMLGNSEAPMWFIAAHDYAKQVARSFEIAGNNNKEYVVQGTDSYTFDTATKVFIENYRKAKLTTLRAPIGVIKFLGSFSQRFNYAWHICEALNKYPEKFESEITWSELGKPALNLAEYAQTL